MAQLRFLSQYPQHKNKVHLSHYDWIVKSGRWIAPAGVALSGYNTAKPWHPEFLDQGSINAFMDSLPPVLLTLQCRKKDGAISDPFYIRQEVCRTSRGPGTADPSIPFVMHGWTLSWTEANPETGESLFSREDSFMTLGPVWTQGESSDDERAKIFPKRFDMPLRVIAQEQLAKLLEQGTFVIEDIPEASTPTSSSTSHPFTKTSSPDSSAVTSSSTNAYEDGLSPALKKILESQAAEIETLKAIVYKLQPDFLNQGFTLDNTESVLSNDNAPPDSFAGASFGLTSSPPLSLSLPGAVGTPVSGIPAPKRGSEDSAESNGKKAKESATRISKGKGRAKPSVWSEAYETDLDSLEFWGETLFSRTMHSYQSIRDKNGGSAAG